MYLGLSGDVVSAGVSVWQTSLLPGQFQKQRDAEIEMARHIVAMEKERKRLQAKDIAAGIYAEQLQAAGRKEMGRWVFLAGGALVTAYLVYRLQRG